MGIKVAMVGAGNLGQAQAAHMALEGHEVRIFNRTVARIEEINERGGILIEGVVQGLARLAVASGDMADVIPGADVVIVTVPASSHRAVAKACAPYLEDGQAVVLHPGHTFGAMDFYAQLVEMGKGDLDLTFAEIQTSLLTARLTGPAQVHVSAIKKALPIAVFPADHGFGRIEVLFDLYPSSIRAPNVLKTGLDNLNAPVHPAVTLLNLGQIDRGEDFLYYWEGFTPYVSKLVEKVDAERCAVARALGVEPITLHGFFDSAYDVEGEELWQKIRSNEAYRGMTAPKKVATRLFLEDLPTGLVPFSSLGQELGVPTPTVDALIEICNVLFQRDFRVEGRNMANMGMQGLGAEGIRAYAQTGKK